MPRLVWYSVHPTHYTLLFITAGMVVERKPCVRGEKE
jgi:hypothetical protein